MRNGRKGNAVSIRLEEVGRVVDFVVVESSLVVCCYEK